MRKHKNANRCTRKLFTSQVKKVPIADRLLLEDLGGGLLGQPSAAPAALLQRDPLEHMGNGLAGIDGGLE
jgi:hypothetical protein